MFVRNVLTPRSTVLANAIQCLIFQSYYRITGVATRLPYVSLFCLVYLTFAKGNEAFTRRVSRFVHPVMEISESGRGAWRHCGQTVFDSLSLKEKRTRSSNGDSQYLHHRHQDSSHMTTSRSAGVHQQVAHSRATTQRRGQRAASRLGADLHAKLLEKLETLYPLLRRVPAEIHPRPSLTISGRRSRRSLVLSSPQTSNPPYQRHRTRCYHIPVSLDLFFYITTSAAKCSSPGQLSRRQHARTRKAPCPLA